MINLENILNIVSEKYDKKELLYAQNKGNHCNPNIFIKSVFNDDFTYSLVDVFIDNDGDIVFVTGKEFLNP